LVVDSGSPLFGPLSASYNAPTGTATVTLDRIAFDAVAGGLTPNEEAVADGLENAYAGVLSGGSAEAQLLYASLFQFNAAQYPAALNMLSDVQAGEVAQRNVLSVKGFDDRIDDRLATLAAIFGAGGRVGKGGSDFTIWGEPYGTWTNTGSTISGPGYHDNVGGATLGAASTATHFATADCTAIRRRSDPAGLPKAGKSLIASLAIPEHRNCVCVDSTRRVPLCARIAGPFA